MHFDHNNFPIIDLGNYILREQTPEDVVDFFNYYSDPEVYKYVVADIPRNLEEARYELKYWIDIYKNGEGIYFGIARKDTNQLVGSIGLSGYNRMHHRIELSYDLAKEYWNLGITTAAIREVVKYGFEHLRINRIEAYSLKPNLASRRVLQKCGFNLEGELKQHRYHNGVYKDIGIFSLVYSDWIKN